jgi:NADH:ubiquinone oxidoreductase subunit 4 (subunit M)
VENPENRGLIDLGLRDKVVLVAVLVPIIWIGVHPQTLLRRLDASAVELLRRVEVGTARASAVAAADVVREEKP